MQKRDNSLLYKLALTMIPGVGPVLARNLVSYCGSVEGVFKEKQSHLVKIPDIGPVTATAIAKHAVFERAEEERLFIEKYSITPMFYTDANYPQRLTNCTDAPVMLYYKGNSDLNSSRMIAIVGTRNATEYGKEITEQLIKDFAGKNISVISGLAYGIDICAHKTSVKFKVPTIGVMGHGLDRIYPPTHKQTAEKMVAHGGLLTEYMSGTKPDKENFPARNRIIAGISDGVIVVEAAKKGGALITAHIADSYNRDVFAVPGKLSDAYSEGCNHLIKTNKAVLIESAADIEYIMGWDDNPEISKQPVQRKLFIDLNAEEKILLDILVEKGAMHIDAICHNSELPLSKVAMNLLNLEFNGILKSLPGKMYELA
jgi:DNA processing protein